MSLVCHIVAVDKNNCIGRGNEMPWHIPSDFKYFKDTTKGHPIVMGRKTFESIGRPLPGRLNIVISRNSNYEVPEGVKLVDSIEEGIELAKKSDDYDTSKVFIIGGAQIYKASQDMTDIFYITRVETEVEGGDAFYPEVPECSKLDSSVESVDVFPLKFEVYSKNNT